MRIVEWVIESIIIVLGCIVIVLPEILYSLILRARDKIVDMIGGLFA